MLHAVGGLGRLLDAAGTAEACGLPLGVHAPCCTAFELRGFSISSPARPAFRYAPDTLYYDLREDVLGARFELADGALTVPEGPGLGIEVDRERVEALAVAGVSRTVESVRGALS